MYHPRHLEHHKEQMHRHACTCTQVLAYTPAVLARTHAHARAHTHTHTRMHAHAHMHAHTHAHARAHTHTHARTRAHTHTRTHTHTTHTHTFTRTHARAHAHKHTQLSLGPTLWPGDMLFYRLACVHMCLWHRTTGIALYFGPKYRQSPTEPNFRIKFLPGSIVHGTLHAFQIRCRNSFGKGEFWQI